MNALNITPIQKSKDTWGIQRSGSDIVVGNFGTRAEALAAIDGATWERESGAASQLVTSSRALIDFHDRTTIEFNSMSAADRARMAPAVDAEFARLMDEMRGAVAKVVGQ